MERLTFDGLFCDIVKCDSTPGGTFCESGMCTMRKVWERLKEYEDTDLEPEQVMELKSFTQGGIHKIDDGWSHVQQLLQAEQDSRLVVLPCKVGDTVYGIKPVKEVDGHLSCEMKHGNVLAFKILENCVLCMVSAKEQFGYPVGFRIEDFGKTVFLTREEAEAALKGGDEG